MANLSFVRYKGNGTKTQFPIASDGVDIGYIRTSDIKVYVDKTLVSSTILAPSPHIVILDVAPAKDSDVLVRREMPLDAPYANFERGNNFGQRQVNNSFLQQLYLTHEFYDGFIPEGFYFKEDVSLGGNRLRNLGDPVDDTDAVNKSVTDAIIERVVVIEQGVTGDSRYISWLYNDGKAAGGELVISVPYNFTSINAVYINGERKPHGLYYSFNASEKTLTFKSALGALDEVVVLIGTDPIEVPELDVSNYVVKSLTDGVVKTLASWMDKVEKVGDSLVKATSGWLSRSLSDRFEDTINIRDFGAVGDGVTDNTAAYDRAIAALPEGSVIRFPKGKYLGSFISLDKAFSFDLTEAVLVEQSSSKGTIQIGKYPDVVHTVSETELNHGDISFTVPNAANLFKTGDIGYLWDGAVRPTGGEVNHEVIKIKSIIGDVITVDGFLASYKGASTIRFMHSVKQLKNVSVIGGLFEHKDNHHRAGVAIYGVDGITVRDVVSTNSTAPAVTLRHSYDATVDNIKVSDPYDVTSGSGYGVQLYSVSRFSITNIKGKACRHIYDQDSAYFGTIDDIVDMDDMASPCVLSHEGFTGYITCNNIRVSTTQYPVSLGGTGYGGATAALKKNHPYRSVTITNVNNTVKITKSPNEFNVAGVYFQNSIIDCHVRGVTVTHLNAESLLLGTSSSVVRINGVANGNCTIKDIKADKIAIAVHSSGDRQGFVKDNSTTTIENIVVDVLSWGVYLQGAWFPNIKGIQILDSILGDAIVKMTVAGTDTPIGVVTGGLQYNKNGGLKLHVDTAGRYIEGSMEEGTTFLGSSVSVAGDANIPTLNIQNTSRLLRLNSTVGTGTDNVTLDAPTVNGQELNLLHVGGTRYSINFLVNAAMPVGTVIASGEFLELVAFNGAWRIKQQS